MHVAQPHTRTVRTRASASRSHAYILAMCLHHVVVTPGDGPSGHKETRRLRKAAWQMHNNIHASTRLMVLFSVHRQTSHGAVAIAATRMRCQSQSKSVRGSETAPANSHRAVDQLCTSRQQSTYLYHTHNQCVRVWQSDVTRRIHSDRQTLVACAIFLAAICCDIDRGDLFAVREPAKRHRPSAIATSCVNM